MFERVGYKVLVKKIGPICFSFISTLELPFIWSCHSKISNFRENQSFAYEEHNEENRNNNRKTKERNVCWVRPFEGPFLQWLQLYSF